MSAAGEGRHIGDDPMINDLLKDLEGHLAKGIDSMKKELGKVRTGRANASILDGLKVDYYGTPTPINQVAAINVPDARLITVKPWEKSLIPEIEKTIRAAQLGLNPQSDGELVRLPMPALTEERRKELVKVVRKMGEDAKVALRSARRDANEMAKELQKEKQISEDDEKQALKRIQESTDRYVALVDDVLKKKEAEIMEV
jgi:ribosome recycling factor